MDNVFYLVSAHTSCIEGIRLSIKNKYVNITQDIVGFSTDEEEDSAGKNVSDSEQWAAKIGKFLAGQPWGHQGIGFEINSNLNTILKKKINLKKNIH